MSHGEKVKVEMKRIDRSKKVRMFHQAKWDEPIIFELTKAGERGINVPKAETEIEERFGNLQSLIPAEMIRAKKPNLPEISQARVLRHYLRISQETLGGDLNTEIGQGTCTVKYSPKVNEVLARMPKMTEMHPSQDTSTAQGILEIFYKTDLLLREISGLDCFSMQPSGGSQAIMAMGSIVKAFHKENGEDEQRNEFITTIYSHPSDSAAMLLKGYKLITIYPDKDGYPDLDAMKASVSKHTAGFIVANPEDTGVYNKRIKEFTKLVHEAGGVCCYDQANANGLLGVTRAKEAGFDMCFFNLHKTFSTPHGCGGPATGALGVTEEFKKFMPKPLVNFNGKEYFLDYNIPKSIGKVRSFMGVAPVVLRAYAWIMSLGAEGLYEVSKIAVLNNNYMYKKILEIQGTSVPYNPNKQRIEQTRYSFETLCKETGVTIDDIQNRMFDYGCHFWTSHHPFIIPSPFTLEPTESYSKDELDEYIEVIKSIVVEAKNCPDMLRNAPHNSVCHKIDFSVLDDPDSWCITWRLYNKKAK